MLNNKKKTIAAAMAGSLALLAIGGAAFSQRAGGAEAALPALYKGADRQKHLLEGAKKEGELLLYTSLSVDDLAELTAAFEKKYGIKVKVWRSGGENVVQRAVTEGHANRFDADVVETNGMQLESLRREKLLQEVDSPYASELIPSAITPHREWISTRLNVYTFAYNTNLIKKEDLPKNYLDLLNPKWKGKLGIEADDADWLAGIVNEMGVAKGEQLFRDVVATNGISVRKGHSLLINLVASGEVPMAMDVYNYNVEQRKAKGAPVEWFSLEPTLAAPQGVAVFRRAPHPNAAVLFYDFMISDAQPILFKRNYVPTSKNLDTRLNKMPMKFIDAKISLDESQKWNKVYDDIIVKQSK
ncbi:extracellular solute-binding protein [Oxalobacteraceae bacterium CAVE-383]|nr:extracellular solute-binding protein [Oxalobacteraceae bacterium CAVE-383]